MTPAKGAVVTSKVPVSVSWTGADGESGWATSQVQQQTNGGAFATVGTSLPSKSLSRSLAPGSTTSTFRVRGIDQAGNIGDWATGPTVKVSLLQGSNKAIHYGGTWHSARRSTYSAGSTRYATSKSASASITFTGRGFGWVGTYGSTRGSARIWVDGKLVATVSSHRSGTTYRPIVWAISWATAGSHRIVIKPAGTAGHARIDLDGLVLVH